jgi:glycosyltransferase involved in cell wall biosynthesis
MRLPVTAFQSFAAASTDRVFVFVDDGSTDETRAVIGGLCEENPDRFRLLALQRNSGKGEAVRLGLMHAARLGADYVGFWDADLSTPLDSLVHFERVLESRPAIIAVIGSRVRLLGRRIERRAVRHYLGRIFATGASMALGLPVYDTQCGAKLFRNDPAFERLLEKPFNSRWIFDVELLSRMTRTHGSAIQEQVYEMPLPEWRDVGGSKLSLSAFVKAGLELMVLYFRMLWARSGRNPAPLPSPGRDVLLPRETDRPGSAIVSGDP